MTQDKRIGVTIGSGTPFEQMAALAARRFSACSGLPAFVLGADEVARHGLQRPHHLKFELFRLFPEAEEIVFFDADVIFCQAFEPNALRSPLGFSAVKDFVNEWWILDDAKRAGIQNTAYFNSGFFWIHRKRADVLPMARELRDSGAIKSGFNDQTFLNAAVARTGGAEYLDKVYNYHVDREHTESLAGVIGAHIHWIPQDAANVSAYYTNPRAMHWREQQPAKL